MKCHLPLLYRNNKRNMRDGWAGGGINRVGDSDHKKVYINVAGRGVLPVLLAVDVGVSVFVLFAAEKFSAAAVSRQWLHYSYFNSSAEVMVLCAVRCLLLLTSVFHRQGSVVHITKGGPVRSSTLTRISICFSLVCGVYSIVKMILGLAFGSAGGWAVAACSLTFAACEYLSLMKLRGTVRTISSQILYDKLVDENSLRGNDEDREDDEEWAREREEQKSKKSLTPRELLGVLKPYFWPKGSDERAVMNRVRSTTTWFCVIASKACSVYSPFFLADATNNLYNGHAQQASYDVVGYATLSFMAKALKEMQNLVYLRVKQQAYVEIAEHTFSHLHRLSLSWHLRKKIGGVTRIMDRGTDAANNLVTYLFLYLVPAIGECVATVIIFYVKFKDWKLATMAFCSLVLYGVVTVKITLWRKKFRSLTNKHDNAFHDMASDSIINYETVKYFTNEEFEVKRYSQSVAKYQRASTSTQSSLSILNTLQQLILALTLIGGLILAAKSVQRGTYSVGDFVSVNTYMVNLFTPLNFLGSVYNVIVQAFVDIRNLSELLAESPDIVDEKGAPDLSLGSSSKGVRVSFREIDFSYPGQASNSGLRGVNIEIEPGTTTAIVGPTGAGKTTISRLLFRFYDPVRGGVFINNQNIRTLTAKSVRQAIGVVPQDTPLFNETILYNVRYGRSDASMAEVEEACRSAQIYDFIMGLPETWESQVGERGLKLSGGEKQRVAIARCLLKNPPIVLLDEATSALDTRTEKGIQVALSGLQQNRTTLVVAHRLSTIRTAEQIVVLSKGQIVERGTHNELVAVKGGEYQQLWNMQLHEDEERERLESEATAAAAAAAAAAADGDNGKPDAGQEESKSGRVD